MNFSFWFVPAALAGALVAIAAPGASAQPVSSEPQVPFEIPGGDIFGFTSPSDVASQGERGIAFELSSRAGKRAGSYWSPTLKTQFSFTPEDNVGVALSPWSRRIASGTFRPWKTGQ